MTRHRLHSVIDANPGIHVRRIATIMGLSWNTVLHHLRAMERGGQVSSCKVQGRVCWFDRKAGAFHAKQGTALLRDAQNLALVAQIMERPGLNQLQLAQRLEIATSIVHRRLVQMEEAGLVERRPVSRSVLVYPAQHLDEVALRGGFLPESKRMRMVPPEEAEPFAATAGHVANATPAATAAAAQEPPGLEAAA